MKDNNWLNKQEYPFTSHYFDLPAGRLHYVDEGQGGAIVFVHGTPVWSFVYRNLIKELSRTNRCIAPDHLGFGLSDKPEDFAYTPEAHCQNLTQLLQHLNLTRITIVLHDFGGPIGLGYAVNNPDKISQLVILNTWMWRLDEEKTFRQASALFGSSFGKILYRKLNFSARVLLPKAFYNTKILTPALHAHYLNPFPDPKSRTGTWRLAKELIASGSWFDSLWQRRKVLENKPILLVWGTKDVLIPIRFLQKWKENFPDARVVELESGHFIQEEKPAELMVAIKQFIR